MLLAQTPFNVEPTDPFDQSTPLLACDSFGCTVAWARDDGNAGLVRTRWLMFDGGLGPVTDCPLLGGFQAPTIQGAGAWSGRRIYVITPDGVSGEQGLFTVITQNPYDTFAAAVTSPLHPQYFSAGRARIATTPDLAVIAYVAISMPFAQVFMRTVTPAGALVPDASFAPTQGTGGVSDPSIVENGGSFYLLFSDRADFNQNDPYFTVWSPDAGFVIDHVLLENTASDELQGALAFAQDHLVAAWTRSRVGVDGVEVVRLELDGGHDHIPRLFIDGGDQSQLSWVNGRGLLAVTRKGVGAFSIEVYRLDELDSGFSTSLRFSTASPRAPTLSLQQLDDTHAYFAFNVDDGGISRAFVVTLDLNDAPDASTPRHAGAADSGATDSGSPDGGQLDGGLADGGTSASTDGGTPPAPGVRSLSASCGCDDGWPFPLLLLAAALVRRVKLRGVGPRFPQ